MERLNCVQARSIDMVDYLSKYGHEPRKIRGNEYWYLSPLRNERTPSFKVNRKINRWFDHGAGMGGNLIDFALLFHNCRLSEWLQGLNGRFLSHHPFIQPPETPGQICIENVLPLESPVLLDYLQQRRVFLSAALQYCAEIRYRVKEKNYLGIGFKNDFGGYEIRNAFYKNSSSPKGITTIKSGFVRVAVFEGFFDFLSFISFSHNRNTNDYSFCILNSLSFFESSRTFLEQHQQVDLYLDNDTAGRKCTRDAQSSSPRYFDKSLLYEGYKDLNEWWSSQKAPP